MNRLRTLFFGGTGIISSACVSEALAAGHDVTVLNRGTTSHRPLPDGVRLITADVRELNSLDAALGTETFDVVADFLSFTPGQVQAHIDRWAGKVGQYIYISSAYRSTDHLDVGGKGTSPYPLQRASLRCISKRLYRSAGV